MSDIRKLQQEVIKFRDERDWKQFHSPKDSAMALASEAIEVLDELKFKSDEQIIEYFKSHKKKMAHELSDVLFWTLLMAHDMDIDIFAAFQEKMKINAKKYPIEKAKGKNTKYTDL